MFLQAAIVFCLVTLAYTFVGYPLLAILRSKVSKDPILTGQRENNGQKVSVVIAMRNEAERALDRIKNLFDSNHPGELLEVVVVSDASEDDTVQILQNAGYGNRLKVIELTERSGKPKCVNEGISKASGEIIVLTDARQEFLPDTIPNLVANFGDPEVGAASGELVIAESDSGAGAGIDFYWKLEKKTRAAESDSGSAIGCTGAIYAIRKQLFKPIPNDTLLDDVVIPMQISMQGYRVIFDPSAIARDPQRLEPGKETRRKERTLAGNFQMLFRYPEWLMPWKSPCWWRVFSHKYLRLAAPVLMALTLVLSAFVVAIQPECLVFQLILWGQVALYILALIGLAMPKVRFKLLTMPAAFLFLNLMVVRGFFYFLNHSRQKQAGW